MVFYDVRDEVIADAAFIPGIIAIDADLVSVVFVESVAGAEPYKTPAVLEDVENIVLGETVIYVQMLEFKPWLLCDSKVACGYYQQGRQK